MSDTRLHDRRTTMTTKFAVPATMPEPTDDWPEDDERWVSEYPGLPSAKSLLPCPNPATAVPRPGSDTLIDTYRRELLCFPV